MTKLQWNSAGERYFEVGVDRGVLFPPSKAGVAWNGLVSVNERPSGGEPTPYYADGIKYVNVVSNTEFEATIEAYTYPDEFEEFDGSASIADGILVGQQERKEFGFSYRTGIGNDLVGEQYGYKIHLVYNALASPSESSYETINDSPEAMTFSWDIATRPVDVSIPFIATPLNSVAPLTMDYKDFKPTAHLTIDSTKISYFALGVIESIIYGLIKDARLPLPHELLALPLNDRPVVISKTNEVADLPSIAKTGDLVFSIEDVEVYSIGTESKNTRLVHVITSNKLSLLPDTAYPGDLVYVETTGELFKLGA